MEKLKSIQIVIKWWMRDEIEVIKRGIVKTDGNIIVVINNK